MTAVAYIRRSASEESPVSEELQRSTIARLAAERGDTIDHVFRDWGRSGGSEDRPEYVAMLARLEENGITAVYAYDQDRLARNNWMFAGLLRLADLHGFAIITPAGNLVDDSRRDFAEMRGVMDGAELRKMKRRARAISEKQDRRGDVRGPAPYGYAFAERKRRSDEPVRHVLVHPERIAHVIDTYKAQGSYLRAAKALNREDYPTQYGKTWHPVVVRDIILREAPELASGVRQGTRGPGRPRLFAKLLRCYCGHTLTPGQLMGKLAYYCSHGQRGLHPRPRTILEDAVLPWIMAEADRLAIPGDELHGPGDTFDDSPERRALEALRDAIGPDAYTLALANLDAKREAQDERERLIGDIPPRIDWERESVADINASLRGMWRSVQLGADLLPIGADWRVPEWRRGEQPFEIGVADS